LREESYVGGPLVSVLQLYLEFWPAMLIVEEIFTGQKLNHKLSSSIVTMGFLG
jgi:hypothetical protein